MNYFDTELLVREFENDMALCDDSRRLNNQSLVWGYCGLRGLAKVNDTKYSTPPLVIPALN